MRGWRPDVRLSGRCGMALFLVAQRPSNIRHREFEVLGNFSGRGAVFAALKNALGTYPGDGRSAEPDIRSHRYRRLHAVNLPPDCDVAFPHHAVYEHLAGVTEHQLVLDGQ